MLRRFLVGFRTAAMLCVGVGMMAVSVTSAAAETVEPTGTTPSIECTPGKMAVYQAATCTATVSDYQITASPTGLVHFTSTVPATFSPVKCMLSPASPDSSTCSVTYTPHDADKFNMVSAAYRGNARFVGGSAGQTFPVKARSTMASLSCAPNHLSVGSTTSCTATVTDIDVAGTASAPSGRVKFYGGTGDKFRPASCALVAQTSDSSTCSVTLSPTAYSPTTDSLRVVYSGNSVDRTSTGYTLVHVKSSAD